MSRMSAKEIVNKAIIDGLSDIFSFYFVTIQKNYKLSPDVISSYIETRLKNKQGRELIVKFIKRLKKNFPQDVGNLASQTLDLIYLLYGEE